MEWRIISTKTNPITIDTHDKTAADQLAAALRCLISSKQTNPQDIIYLCIGTDRATGDALGPLAGYLLAKTGLAVYGNLKKPVHAGNLTKTLEKIKHNHKNPLIIAIDACLGSSDKIGKLVVKEGGLIPAMAMAGAEDLPKTGDISIIGVVNISAAGSGQCPLAVLSSTRLGTVMHMAEVIAAGIIASASFL